MPRCADISPAFPSHSPDTPYTEKMKIFFQAAMRLCKLLPRHAEIHILNIYKIKLLTIKRCGKPHLYLVFTTEL